LGFPSLLEPSPLKVIGVGVERNELRIEEQNDGANARAKERRNA